MLSEGKENARTGKQLAALCGCDIRTVTEQIERERRQGKPICAESRGENSGYFLAADKEELQKYCEKLRHRAIELFKTRKALIAVSEQMPEQLGE